MSSGLNVLQPFGFHGFYLAIPCCFGSSLSAQSRSEKPQAGAGGLGWGILLQGLLGQNLRERGGGQLLLSTRHWLFWEMQCKHSDDFVEFCEFQSSIKQPAISVLCLILDRRQAISSLAGCLAIYILFIDRPDRLSLPTGDFFVEWGVKCTSSGMGLLFPIRANFFR